MAFGEREAGAGPRDNRFMLADLTPIQRVLAKIMSEISEDAYCAGWLVDLEYELWQILVDGQGKFGFGAVSEAEIEELRLLSDLCGGWIVWDEERGGQTFVPFDQWLKIFAARTSERRE